MCGIFYERKIVSNDKVSKLKTKMSKKNYLKKYSILEKMSSYQTSQIKYVMNFHLKINHF